MKIWLSKNSEVSVREQLVAQITLGITSGDLPVGEKLPSTQEIARRFQIHSNTVSNAYQKLAEDGWVEFKKGSGFYVCEVEKRISQNEFALDSLIADFIKQAQTQGFSRKEIKDRLQKWFDNQPKEMILIESDEDFREILVSEIKDAIEFKISGISLREFKANRKNNNAILLAMSDEENKIREILSPDRNCIYLRSRSVPASMTGESRPEKEELIAVVSGWEKFLFLAKTILLAANIENESLIIRSTKEENWQNGLKNASMIICDSLTAKKIQHKSKLRPFYLIADESMQEIKNLVNL